MTGNDRPLTKIFLLGAGSSQPAGISTIDEMTREFLGNPFYPENRVDENLPELKKNILLLNQVTKNYFEKSDIELIMTLILQLEDKHQRDLFQQKHPELKDLIWESADKPAINNVNTIKLLIQQYIRRKCENIKSIDYLSSLQGFIGASPLKIFTLNYDATIEIFCEKNDIEYSDGFNPYWNPENFSNKLGLHLFKLHGSLYWLRSASGKTMKVPLKGLRSSEVKYLTDEMMSEMMIYPALSKNKQPIVYSWLSQRFKDELISSDVCIIIGYSFRDDDIKDTIIESLSGNHKLWLIIISPNASKHNNSLTTNNIDIASRILCIDSSIQKVLTNRTLHGHLQILQLARRMEEEAWKSQNSLQIRLDQSWSMVLANYLRINFHDRVKWIVEKLQSMKFSGYESNFPNCVEGVVGPPSFRYLFEYAELGDFERYWIWRDVFLQSCTAYEYTLFSTSNQGVLVNGNPIAKSELPRWCSEKSSLSRDIPKDLLQYATEVSNRLSDPELKSFVSRLKQTLEFVLGRGRTMIDTDPHNFLATYHSEQLGVKLSAMKIVSYYDKKV